MDDLLSAHRDSPLSLTMHTMRNLTLGFVCWFCTLGGKGLGSSIVADMAGFVLFCLYRMNAFLKCLVHMVFVQCDYRATAAK
jgi:hypothetical protein